MVKVTCQKGSLPMAACLKQDIMYLQEIREKFKRSNTNKLRNCIFF